MNLFHLAEDYLDKTNQELTLTNIVNVAIKIRKWMDGHPKQTKLMCEGLDLKTSSHRAYYKKLGLL